MPGKSNLSEMSVKELEKEAKDAGIAGYSGMKKEELVRALEKQLPAGPSRGGSRAASSRGSANLPGILGMLKEEHDEVKSLFDRFEKEADRDLQGAARLVDTVLQELMRHAEMEEQIVYPGLRQADSDVYHEAHEEHHVAELLMGEISNMGPDETYKAKVIVLAENVRHHIEEEESEAFKALKKLPREQLEEMASQWEETKSRWQMRAS